MRSSIRNRLRHPRAAIRQGLPSRRDRGPASSSHIAVGLTAAQHKQIESYLDAIPVHSASTKGRAQQEYLYHGLSIIDAKAQALLGFNSFLLAIVGIYFGNIGAVRSNLFVSIPFIGTVVTSGVSCLLCLDVIWVYWLSQTDMEQPEHGSDSSPGFVELLLLRDERTRNYRVSWLLSFVAVVAAVFGVLISILTTISR